MIPTSKLIVELLIKLRKQIFVERRGKGKKYFIEIENKSETEKVKEITQI